TLGNLVAPPAPAYDSVEARAPLRPSREHAKMQEARYEARQPKTGRYSLTWKSSSGQTSSCDATGIDISSSGIGVECSVELKTGGIFYVEAQGRFASRECEVVHCTRRGAAFRVGLEFRHELTVTTQPPAAQHPIGHEPDHYETLQ